jgi:hypothetical protein
MKLNIYEPLNYWIFQSDPRKKNQLKSRIQKETLHCTQTTNKQTNALLSIKRPTMSSIINKNHTRCIFITTPFRLNRRACLLSESGNATFRSYVQTTCISNWLIWGKKGMQDFSEQFTEHFNHHSNSK